MPTSPRAPLWPEILPPEMPDLGDYLAAIKRRMGLLLRIALPILTISIALAVGLPDIYVARGIVRFSDATISAELPTLPISHSKIFPDLYMIGLAGAVLSPPVLVKLMREVPEVVTPGEAREDIMSDIADRTRVVPVKMPILDPHSGRQRDVISAFAITYSSRDPRLAQKVAAWLTNAFIGGNRVGLQMRVRAASQFYLTMEQTYGRQIAALDSQLAEFKARHFRELPELTQMNLGDLGNAQRELDDIADQVRTLDREQIMLQGQLAQAGTADLDQGLLSQLQNDYNQKLTRYDPNHPEMLNLRRQINALRSSGQSADTLSIPAQLQVAKQTLAQLRQRYSPDHPDVQRLQRQIGALQSQLHGKSAASATASANTSNAAVVRLTTQLGTLAVQKKVLEQREVELRDKMSDMERRVDTSPLIEHEYGTLRKELAGAHAKYDELSRNAMELELTGAAIASGRSDDMILVQAPDLPEKPAKPRRLVILMIGAALALFAGLSAVIFREAFDSKVRNSRDVHRMLKTWPLVAIPVIHDPQRIRRRYWQLGALTACTLMVSVGALITGRMFLY